MGILTYSLKLDKDKKVSTNFTVNEFRSKCGADIVFVCEGLYIILQKIRDWAGASVNINSAYRSAAHNKAVGGSPNSQHLYGKAADIRVTGKTPLEVARYAELLGAGGIGLADADNGNFVHIDTRAVKVRFEYYNNGKNTRTISGFGGVVSEAPPKQAAGAPGILPLYLNTEAVQVRNVLIDGSNYVNLRDIIEHLNGVVIWDDATRQIRVVLPTCRNK